MTDSLQAPESRSRELRPIYVVNFLRRNLWMILLLGMVTGLAYWAFAQMTRELAYQSACSLVITPRSGSSSFRQDPLSVTAYKQMLGSGALISETKRRLVEEGLLEASDPLRLGKELRSRIFLSDTKKGQASAGVPLLELVSVGKTPEAAARAANLWAEVFLEQNRAMVVASTTEAIEIFERLYPQAQEKLQALELQDVQQTAQQGQRLRALQDQAGDRSRAYGQETLRLITEYNNQTKQMELEFKINQMRPQQEARLRALEQAYQALQQDLAKVDDSLAAAEAERAAVKGRLEQTPQRIRLQRIKPPAAVEMEQKGHGSRGEAREAESTGPLWTEESINPVYLELDRRLAAAAVNAEILRPEKLRLQNRLEELSGELRSVSEGLERGATELEKLKLDRSAGLATLKLQRDEDLAALKRGEAQGLSEQKRQAETASAQLRREVAFQLESYKKLQSQVTQASLAREQLAVEDVRMSTKAVPSDYPLPLNTGFKTVIAFLVGALLGFLLSLAKEVIRSEAAATA
ncbi:MAG: hypothetical protein K0U98_02110 [Deltaproteobacteria bacterium]|nr:hypothetical protein [Deltaproteobacteria bacterium]